MLQMSARSSHFRVKYQRAVALSGKVVDMAEEDWRATGGPGGEILSHIIRHLSWTIEDD